MPLKPDIEHPESESRRVGYAIVGIFVLAAIVTPPDVVSQLMLAIPMCALYELGIHAARWLTGRPRVGQGASS